MKQILKEVHDSPLDGHFGVNKTLEKIRKRFYWLRASRMSRTDVSSIRFVFPRRAPQERGSLRYRFIMLDSFREGTNRHPRFTSESTCPGINICSSL